MTTLREELSAEVSAIVSREKDKRFWRHSSKAPLDEAALKKKYLSQVMSSAKEELEVEYKRCVQDIVDFSSNFARKAFTGLYVSSGLPAEDTLNSLSL